MTDLQAQDQSSGIIYEPYEKQFKLCIFEEPNVQGRNERYEFRCDANLFCCGRVCCLTDETAAATFFGLPLWLLLLLLLLALLLLAALLPLLWYLCCRRRDDKKGKAVSRTLRRGDGDYRTIGDGDGDDAWRRRGGDGHHYSDLMPNGRGASSSQALVATPLKRSSSFREEETFEEEFHEEIEIEEGGGAGGRARASSPLPRHGSIDSL